MDAAHGGPSALLVANLGARCVGDDPAAVDDQLGFALWHELSVRRERIRRRFPIAGVAPAASAPARSLS
jgi:hypothetical protein